MRDRVLFHVGSALLRARPTAPETAESPGSALIHRLDGHKGGQGDAEECCSNYEFGPSVMSGPDIMLQRSKTEHESFLCLPFA